MNHLSINEPMQFLIQDTWFLQGEGIAHTEKRIKHLGGVFKDETIRLSMDQEKLVYQVQAHLPVKEGTPGGLYFGTTLIYPGKVGSEYFMTRGHFHANADRAEYYWGVQGEGMLILMDRDRKIWAEKMFPGSLHYIDSNTAHRTANTGIVPFIFGACWHSDAGHDYDVIARSGFSARLIDIGGIPTLM
jgi:glucose-6-phosphate isomerase, archaeal